MSRPLILPQSHSTFIRATWVALALLVIADAVWMAGAGIRFPLRTLALIAGASALLGAISVVYGFFRKDDAIWLASQVVNQMIVGSCALATFNYLGLRLDYPLIDGKLVAADEWLGFDWTAYVAWVDRHPAIAHILTLCYTATGPEILIILALLCLFKRFGDFHRYALSYLSAGFITICIGNVLPATAAYIYRKIPAASYPHVQVADAVAYGPDFFAMRGHTLSALPEVFQGLVAFPSFHSTLAVLAIVAAGSFPSRVLGAVVILINTVMLLATPVDGGHYLVDTLCGIFIGIVVSVFVARILPQSKADNTAISSATPAGN